MKFAVLFILILITSLNSLFAQEKIESDSILPILKGRYLDQKPPGITVELFAPNLISPAQKRHSKISVSPDGSEIYWSFYNTTEKVRKIAYKSYDNGSWGAEELADFNSQYGSDSPCFFGNDKIIFHAKRNIDIDTISIVDDFWVVERINDGWAKPKPLGFNNICEIYKMPMPTIADNGNIYFNGKYEGGKYNLGIYVSYLADNNYSPPVLLSKEINSEHLDWIPFIAPDESYLIFASGRCGEKGGTSDLYISFKDDNGNWLNPLNMGDGINSKLEERFPSVTPNGKILFFMRDVNQDAKYYWVDAKIIEELRAKQLK